MNWTIVIDACLAGCTGLSAYLSLRFGRRAADNRRVAEFHAEYAAEMLNTVRDILESGREAPPDSIGGE